VEDGFGALRQPTADGSQGRWESLVAAHLSIAGMISAANESGTLETKACGSGVGVGGDYGVGGPRGHIDRLVAIIHMQMYRTWYRSLGGAFGGRPPRLCLDKRKG
jgi:hypothetical protein